MNTEFKLIHFIESYFADKKQKGLVKVNKVKTNPRFLNYNTVTGSRTYLNGTPIKIRYTNNGIKITYLLTDDNGIETEISLLIKHLYCQLDANNNLCDRYTTFHEALELIPLLDAYWDKLLKQIK